MKLPLKSSSLQETALPPFSGVGTIFLCDVVDFKVPNDGVDSVALAREMNGVFAGIHECIRELGGLIVSSTGDAVLAVWGPSFVAPSHAELALACGRKILERLQKGSENSKFSYSLRIILATGQLDGRSVGGRFQVFGQPLAVAKRLEALQISKHSQILCTSETLACIPTGNSSDPIGQIKGAEGNDVMVYAF